MAARGVNKVILIGHLGNNPKIVTTANFKACQFSMATNENYKDRYGQVQERTEWHRIVMYYGLAEIAGKYLKKGKQIWIEGKLRTRQWKTQSGETKYITEIVAEEMQMLGSKPQESAVTSFNESIDPLTDEVVPSDVPF